MGLQHATASLNFSQAVLRYFSPSLSPYYGIIAAAAASLVLSCSGISDSLYWRAVAIPAAVVLIVCVALTFASRVTFSREEHEEQLRFVRASSISAAVLLMVFVVDNVEGDVRAFYLGYSACLVQAFTFLLYAWARNYSRETHTKINLVQLSLVTTALISAASAALIQRAAIDTSFVPTDPAVVAPGTQRARYWLVACSLYAVWGCCIAYWIRHLTRLIHISVPVDTHTSLTGEAGSGIPTTATVQEP